MRANPIPACLPLLPIFLVGVFPMLLFELARLCRPDHPRHPADLRRPDRRGWTPTATSTSRSSSTAMRAGPERAVQASNLHSAMRFATVMTVAGAGLIVRLRLARLSCGLRADRQRRASLRLDAPGTRPLLTNSSLALSRKNLSMDMPLRGSMPPRPDFRRQQEARGDFQNAQILLQRIAEPEQGRAVPGGSRPRLSSRSPSTPARATSSSRNFSPSIRTARCRRSTMTASWCSTATPSCSTSPKRPASSCRRTRRPTARELLSWLMFVATGVGPYSRPGRALQALRAGRRARIRPQPLPVRGAAPLRHPQRPSRRQQLHGRRHLHHRRHGVVGLGAHGPPSCWATMRSRNIPTSSGWSTRSRRGRRRRRRSR